MIEDYAQTVWITNEGGHKDYDKALLAAPGADIKPLTLGSVNIFRTDRLLADLAGIITRRSRPGDYVLPSGNAIVSALAIEVWLTTHGVCNLLLWHAAKRIYIPETIERAHVQELVEREMARIS